jgi:hypothetical protein
MMGGGGSGRRRVRWRGPRAAERWFDLASGDEKRQAGAGEEGRQRCNSGGGGLGRHETGACGTEGVGVRV